MTKSNISKEQRALNDLVCMDGLCYLSIERKYMGVTYLCFRLMIRGGVSLKRRGKRWSTASHHSDVNSNNSDDTASHHSDVNSNNSDDY